MTIDYISIFERVMLDLETRSGLWRPVSFSHACTHTSKHTLTYTPLTSGVRYRVVTECMNLKTRGGKAINHASPSLFFLSLHDARGYRGRHIICLYCNSKGKAEAVFPVLTQNRTNWGAACWLVVHKVLNQSKGPSSSTG